MLFRQLRAPASGACPLNSGTGRAPGGQNERQDPPKPPTYLQLRPAKTRHGIRPNHGFWWISGGILVAPSQTEDRPGQRAPASRGEKSIPCAGSRPPRSNDDDDDDDDDDDMMMMMMRNVAAERTVARAWRGHGAGVARAFGHFLAWVARAWRRHGAGVARACPVTPGRSGH
eukprot:gene8560-biopygen1605